MRSLELFSGAGGLALGLEQAGFTSVALFERDGDACATLRANRPYWNVRQGDVCEVDFSRFGPVELVAGGPPCQPFSVGGKARGSGDARDMFPQAVRAVRELRPAAFIFENVRGLLRPCFGNYVEFVRLQLTYPDFPISDNVDWETNLRRLERHHTANGRPDELTYKVTLNLADAADYGVPQRRHRVFFVGFRSDLDANWFFPAPTHRADELLRSKFLTGDYWREHRLPRPAGTPTAETYARLANLEPDPILADLLPRWRTVRDAIAGLPDPREDESVRNHVFQAGARVYPGHTGSPLDEPAKALKAGDHGVPGGENMMRHPNGQVRYFTVRESARIQTFPDNYVFQGSWTESMRQIGNAVPVRLASVVASSVFEKLRRYAITHDLQSA
jgi:DNA (cytosine-5)-methyltransferase 1